MIDVGGKGAVARRPPDAIMTAARARQPARSVTESSVGPRSRFSFPTRRAAFELGDLTSSGDSGRRAAQTDLGRRPAGVSREMREFRARRDSVGGRRYRSVAIDEDLTLL
jgi:hypothetical protein